MGAFPTERVASKGEIIIVDDPESLAKRNKEYRDFAGRLQGILDDMTLDITSIRKLVSGLNILDPFFDRRDITLEAIRKKIEGYREYTLYLIKKTEGSTILNDIK